jgi:hypothetical protein
VQPLRLEAAMQNSFMKEREVINVVRKIHSALEHVTFPVAIDTL